MENDKITITMELTSNQLTQLMKALDFTSRIYCGQWDNICSLMFENTTEDGNHMYSSMSADIKTEHDICELRNKICPEFETDNIWTSSSYGINNKKISDNARVIYDLYKEFMYSNGASGVYGYKPSPISKEPAPIIKFPDIDEIIWTGENVSDMLKFLNTDISHFYANGKYYVNEKDYENGNTFFPIEIGDIIAKKWNGNCYIKNAERNKK